MKKVISIALVLVMVFALTVSASALVSPGGRGHYGITVGQSPADGSLGNGSSDKDSVIVTEDEDGNVTLTADEKNNGKFQRWEIEGDYDIVEGSLTDKTIVIRPKSDIHAVAVFKGPDGSTNKVPATNNKPTSPQTGDPLYIVLALAVLALGTGALAVKKIKE